MYQFWNWSLQLPCWANKYWSACLSSYLHLHFFIACHFLPIAEIRVLFFQLQWGSHCFVTSLSDDLRWSEQEVGAKWQHTGAIQGSDLPPHCQQHIQGCGAQTSRSWGWSAVVFLNIFYSFKDIKWWEEKNICCMFFTVHIHLKPVHSPELC